jgi:hypothetical protein
MTVQKIYPILRELHDSIYYEKYPHKDDEITFLSVCQIFAGFKLHYEFSVFPAGISLHSEGGDYCLILDYLQGVIISITNRPLPRTFSRYLISSRAIEDTHYIILHIDGPWNRKDLILSSLEDFLDMDLRFWKKIYRPSNPLE